MKFVSCCSKKSDAQLYSQDLGVRLQELRISAVKGRPQVGEAADTARIWRWQREPLWVSNEGTPGRVKTPTASPQRSPNHEFAESPNFVAGCHSCSEMHDTGTSCTIRESQQLSARRCVSRHHQDVENKRLATWQPNPH